MIYRTSIILISTLTFHDLPYVHHTNIDPCLYSMPKLQELDLSGNHCTGIGMVALKQAIISHSALTDDDEGIKVLNLSHNLGARRARCSEGHCSMP